MNAPAFTQDELASFARRAKVDIASAWLALPKIKKYGLTLDHPRAGKLARGEYNRSIRAEWASGSVSLDAAEVFAGLSGSHQADAADLVAQCRMAMGDTSLAPGQIEDGGQDAQITRMLQLKHAVKPRDREILQLRFERGLSIKEIAEETGKTRAAIYKSLDRIKPLMRGARERDDWCKEHAIVGTGDAPVVLHGAGQMGWDFGGAA